ncbi:NAD(P)-binding domain-containing protein [Streptomyces sp. 404i]|uniref:NAD(P)-binding domain-containing protein n=1 Tax=Streptomyces sp. 404i TaxID=2824902 RepID=UPI0035A8E8BD
MRVGFISAGPMRAPMVERLIAAGHDVVVSSPAPAALPAAWRTVSGPAAAADGADVICTVPPDSEEVRTVVGRGRGPGTGGGGAGWRRWRRTAGSPTAGASCCSRAAPVRGPSPPWSAWTRPRRDAAVRLAHSMSPRQETRRRAGSTL